MNIYKVVTISLLALVSACSAIEPANREDLLRLHDIWALEKMQGELVSINQGLQRPQLEIHLRDMKIIGNDGCNNFSGSISSLDEEIISFGPVMGTRMFCQEMELPDGFNQQLNKVAAYKLDDLRLLFFDTAGEELLIFKKVD